MLEKGKDFSIRGLKTIFSPKMTKVDEITWQNNIRKYIYNFKAPIKILVRKQEKILYKHLKSFQGP